MKFKDHRIDTFVSYPILCASFYRDHFSFKASGEWEPTWAEVDADGFKLGFHQAYDESHNKITTPTGSSENPHRISFIVDDVDASRQKLVNQGVKMSEIKDFDGWKICNGYDCEGNIFQLSNR